jgi:hypothetical protein
MICAGRIASLEAVPQVGDGMAEMRMIVLCGGHTLPDLLRDLAPVAALAGGVVLGILYLLHTAGMERGVMSRASRRQPDPR